MHINTTVYCVAVLIRVEDITNNLAILIRSVSNFKMLLCGDVGQTSHENTTRETIEVLRVVTINIALLPNLELLTVLVYSLDNEVEVRILVHRLPKRLSICRVSTSTVILFSTIVNKWNTTRSK